VKSLAPFSVQRTNAHEFQKIPPPSHDPTGALETFERVTPTIAHKMSSPGQRVYGSLKDKRYTGDFEIDYMTRVIDAIKAQWGPDFVKKFHKSLLPDGESDPYKWDQRALDVLLDIALITKADEVSWYVVPHIKRITSEDLNVALLNLKGIERTIERICGIWKFNEGAHEICDENMRPKDDPNDAKMWSRSVLTLLERIATIWPDVNRVRPVLQKEIHERRNTKGRVKGGAGRLRGPQIPNLEKTLQFFEKEMAKEDGAAEGDQIEKQAEQEGAHSSQPIQNPPPAPSKTAPPVRRVPYPTQASAAGTKRKRSHGEIQEQTIGHQG
jgi:hypothetical protein